MSHEDALLCDWFADLLKNPVFLAPLTAFIAAQVIKTLLLVVVKKERRGKVILANLLWRTGGIPSSHAAVTLSLVAAIALTEGPTTSFIIALFLAGVVIRDALGVRRSAGLQAEALNALGRGLTQKGELDWQPVKEIHGHTPLEVALGGILGVVDAVLLRSL